MPPKTEQEHEFWAGKAEARLSNLEKQVDAVWVRLGSVGQDVSETKTEVREMRAMLTSMPERVQSLEESRAKGRGAWAAILFIATSAGAAVGTILPSWLKQP
ncbi:MAG TPA: hypothetical protein PLD57_17720 [Aggregatilineales bacterium]|nr:hypothetical protein [Aggregatilineales bacterium]